MGHWGRSIPVVVLLVGIVVFAASCGGDSALTGRTHLADIADLTLTQDRPGHVWVCVGTEQKLRIFMITRRPLESCTLAKVAASDGSAIPVQPVSLQGSPHSAPWGETTYALLTRDAVTPGTYRVELVGTGRITSLVVDERGTE